MKQRAADVVIVGLGAAGGVVAHVLTAAGLDVVGLEAGPRLSAEMMTLDEVRNDIHSWLSDPKSASEVPTWRSTETETAIRSPWPMLMVNAVGGTTVHYDAASFRLNPWNFASRSQAVARYGAGVLPAGTTMADWPLTYEELEPFYDETERAIGVSGTAGNLQGRIVPGGNPFEGERQREYPLGPLRRTGWLDLMTDAAQSLGWHPYPAPAAIYSEAYNGSEPCTFCGYCRNNGCYRDAKGSTDGTVIRAAEETGLLRIETGARVVRIDVDEDGLATGVTYVKDGREYVQPARCVVLGTFVYENSRLLLLSSSKPFPQGLSNNHGQVGKHYTAHLQPFVHGHFPGVRLNRFNGSSGSHATCLDDWNADAFDHDGLGFVGGAMFMTLQELKPIESARSCLPPWVPRWGSAWKAWLAEHAQSVGSVFAQIESPTFEHRYLDLDPQLTDPHGLPVVRVTHRVTESERRAGAFLCEKLADWLTAAGAAATWGASADALPVEARHPYGGTRMGRDPDESVVDEFGFSHEVPNLAVVGASTFPTSGGHNPTLTLQALAWRTAAHLTERWGERSR